MPCPPLLGDFGGMDLSPVRVADGDKVRYAECEIHEGMRSRCLYSDRQVIRSVTFTAIPS